jgi:hypothetical protein
LHRDARSDIVVPGGGGRRTLPSQYLHLQLLLLFPEDIFALCTSGSLNDPDATTSPPPSDISYSTVAW